MPASRYVASSQAPGKHAPTASSTTTDDDDDDNNNNNSSSCAVPPGSDLLIPGPLPLECVPADAVSRAASAFPPLAGMPGMSVAAAAAAAGPMGMGAGGSPRPAAAATALFTSSVSAAQEKVLASCRAAPAASKAASPPPVSNSGSPLGWLTEWESPLGYGAPSRSPAAPLSPFSAWAHREETNAEVEAFVRGIEEGEGNGMCDQRHL